VVALWKQAKGGRELKRGCCVGVHPSGPIPTNKVLSGDCQGLLLDRKELSWMLKEGRSMPCMRVMIMNSVTRR
jgi:hypothetical protein